MPRAEHACTAGVGRSAAHSFLVVGLLREVLPTRTSHPNTDLTTDPVQRGRKLDCVMWGVSMGVTVAESRAWSWPWALGVASTVVGIPLR